MEFKDIDRSLYTPMMQQYLDIKKDYVDTLVFFRLGDFYEMFFKDAYIASRELEIALTGRDAGAKERVPMCGVPHHAANTYIEKLIEKGYKVAIVEQVEEPTAGKKLVKRDVVRLITPGTVMDEGSIESKENNYLVAIKESKKEYIVAYSDLSTGENYITSIPKQIDLLINEVLILNTKEVIVSESFNKEIIKMLENNYQIIISYENDCSVNPIFKGLMINCDDECKEAFSLILNYISRTQKRELLHLKPLEIYSSKQFLRMDIHSINSLEILSNMRNNTRIGSLLWLLDHCQTAMGSRELKKWLTKPLINASQLNKRYDFVEALMNNLDIKTDLISMLKTIYDLERIVGRVSYGNANARDLFQLKRSLEKIPSIKDIVANLPCDYAKEISLEINPLNELYEVLDNSIREDCPLTIKEGGIIKEGFNELLDKYHNVNQDGKKWLLDYEQKQKDLTGIKTMKVGYNRVFGYYIEVSKGAVSSLPEDINYERKQTTANSERYITPDLKEYETLILEAKDKSISLEYEIFVQIRNEVSKFTNELQKLAGIISMIDVFTSFAVVSEKNNYVRPKISMNREVVLIDSRHPVIEEISDDIFVANDIIVNKYNTLLITGPNMSGKSTYMRQLALNAIMAQIGCFVCAKSATLPIFDQIFTRIGAADDLISGQSTFMVEMMEVKKAISNATKDSLILFDEIGRGTATYDGMALAQSIIEYVHEKIGCITMFSTHYHELTVLENTLKRLKNVHVSAKEEKGGVVFLHKVLDGATDKSYGINVAQLANLPKPLINRANQILTELEKKLISKEINIDLFNFDEVEEETPYTHEVLEELKRIDVNDLTPIQALNILSELKNKVSD